MSASLKNVARLSVLALAVAGFTGCGSENPMGPTSLATTAPTTMETQQSFAPVDEEVRPGDGVETPTVIPNTGGTSGSGKTLWVDRPGRRHGWGRDR